MNEYTAGSTSIVETIFLQDSTSTSGAGKASLVFNTAGLTCYYKRSNGTASVPVTLVDITTLGSFASGGFKAVDNTNMPGIYEFHLPDASLLSGAREVTFFFQGATGLAPRPIKFRILAVNPDSATAYVSSVPSVVGGVTVTTNNDKTGYTLSVTPPTAAQVRTEMDSNSTKLANLDAAISSRSTYAGADTTGTGTLLSRLTSTRAGYLDNLSTAPPTLAAIRADLERDGGSLYNIATDADNASTNAILAFELLGSPTSGTIAGDIAAIDTSGGGGSFTSDDRTALGAIQAKTALLSTDMDNPPATKDDVQFTADLSG